jgi:hypothetical protein
LNLHSMLHLLHCRETETMCAARSRHACTRVIIV